MISSAPRIGSHSWAVRNEGNLSRADRRALLRPLARTHAANALGRTSLFLRLNSGRRAVVPYSELRHPTSSLTEVAEQRAVELLTPGVLHHSYRTYLFGMAVGHLEGVDVDRELLFASAMLHDTGLVPSVPGVDFSLSSAAIALEVAEAVGLSTAATQIMRDAICLHHSPKVSLAEDGAVAYLLSAGAGLDVAGLRSWKVPPDLLQRVVTEYPRLGFKREFIAAVDAEAEAVPNGRMQFLRRYGAFNLAIRLAPFRD